MAERSNACSETVRFWLQARHGCLVTESVPVFVRYGISDIDLVAAHPVGRFALPDGTLVGPRMVVEAKDEHDFDPTGNEFGKMLLADVQKMAGGRFIPKNVAGTKFTMLREQHHETAASFFGTEDFDRLLVVHELAQKPCSDTAAFFAERRVYWLTIREVVADLVVWYHAHPRRAALRHSFVGDLFHLLIGFCGLTTPPTGADSP